LIEMKQKRHELTSEDRARRRGDRRLAALRGLRDQKAAYERDLALPDARRRGVAAGLTPYEFASSWRVHPTSAFRVLERLRKSAAVDRVGSGLGAVYWVTDAGLARMEWLAVKAKVDERLKAGRARR
jgi:hypothetical protein